MRAGSLVGGCSAGRDWAPPLRRSDARPDAAPRARPKPRRKQGEME
jgi:hypothetical protein